MAISTVAFALTAAAYQDVSGGYENCSFRLPLVAQRNNVIRVHLGTSLPAADTTNFDEFMAPHNTDQEWVVHFSALSTTDRVYIRAARADVHLVAYRK